MLACLIKHNDGKVTKFCRLRSDKPEIWTGSSEVERRPEEPSVGGSNPSQSTRAIDRVVR